MSEGVVPDLMSLGVNARREIREFISLNSDQEKSSRRLLALQNIQDLRSPVRIRTVIEGYGNAIAA